MYCFQMIKFSILTGLHRVRVCLFPCDDWKANTFYKCETSLQSCLESDLRARGYDLLTKKMNIHWVDYSKKWVEEPFL
jgi:hypothetical protein